MNTRNVLVAVALTASLAACFTSEEPFIGDDNAVAPYARITYSQEGTEETHVLVREGNRYTVDGEPASAMRFAPVGDNLYVVQASADNEGEVVRFYALIAVDLDTGIARAYKAVAEPGDVGPGLRQCDEDLVCIDDLDAYVARAKEVYQAGAEPSAVYNITVE